MSAAAGGGGLSELDDAVLSLAANPPRSEGQMSNEIRQLGMSAIGFYQHLNRLLDTEAALAAYPRVVTRLRERRETRVRWRSARSDGG